jgi:hypothetical protein
MSSPNSVAIGPATTNKDVIKFWTPEKHEQTWRTTQFVYAEIKFFYVGELAEFRGDQPCHGRHAL